MLASPRQNRQSSDLAWLEGRSRDRSSRLYEAQSCAPVRWQRLEERLRREAEARACLHKISGPHRLREVVEQARGEPAGVRSPARILDCEKMADCSGGDSIRLALAELTRECTDIAQCASC